MISEIRFVFPSPVCGRKSECATSPLCCTLPPFSSPFLSPQCPPQLQWESSPEISKSLFSLHLLAQWWSSNASPAICSGYNSKTSHQTHNDGDFAMRVVVCAVFVVCPLIKSFSTAEKLGKNVEVGKLGYKEVISIISWFTPSKQNLAPLHNTHHIIWNPQISKCQECTASFWNFLITIILKTDWQ